MRYTISIFLLLLFFIILSGSCFSQDSIAKFKILGLKGLDSVEVVVRQNVKKEFMTLKELGDVTETTLHRNVPALGVSLNPCSEQAWLEISYITSELGVFIELSVYRWVKVLSSGEEIFSKVWWDQRSGFGGASKSDFKDLLDNLFTSFAADYLRANK